MDTGFTGLDGVNPFWRRSAGPNRALTAELKVETVDKIKETL